MTLLPTIIVIGLMLLLIIHSHFKAKRYEPGRLPLVSPILVQFLAMIILFVLIAHLISITTGLIWEPPFRR